MGVSANFRPQSSADWMYYSPNETHRFEANMPTATTLGSRRNSYVPPGMSYQFDETDLTDPPPESQEPGLGIIADEQQSYRLGTTRDLSSDQIALQQLPLAADRFRLNHEVFPSYEMQLDVPAQNDPMRNSDVDSVELEASYRYATHENSYDQFVVGGGVDIALRMTEPTLQEPFSYQPSLSWTVPNIPQTPWMTSSTVSTPLSTVSTQWTSASSPSYWSFKSPTVQRPSTEKIAFDSSPKGLSSEHNTGAHRSWSSHGRAIHYTYPPQRKPRLRPSLSESYVTQRPSPRRQRAITAAASPLVYPNDSKFQISGLPDQLPLPACPPSVLVSESNRHGFSSAFRPIITTIAERLNPTAISVDTPSSPSPADLTASATPYLKPIIQKPKFVGDIYTPRYKRRNANNRWEGWCGYCQPGRWLDLKNSRYWEDKLRNHGICARTKMKFPDPDKIRHVEVKNEHDDSLDNNPESMSKFPNLPVIMRREGFCSNCKEWIFMDGLRTRARGRAVGWWIHSYECRHKGKSEAEDVCAT